MNWQKKELIMDKNIFYIDHDLGKRAKEFTEFLNKGIKNKYSIKKIINIWNSKFVNDSKDYVFCQTRKAQECQMSDNTN